MSGSLEGLDDEDWPFSDVTMFKPITPVRVVLTVEDVPQNVVSDSMRWGGECRLEVTVTAQLQTRGRILVTVNGKLFEGDSEATTDMDDERTSTTLVPRGGIPIPFVMQLSNSGLGGGDTGTIKATFTNIISEEE